MSLAYLSLGSNIGDRVNNLDDALRSLPRPGITLLRVSSVYETEPQDFVSQPWFLNLVAEVETSLSPQDLLSHCLAIELAMGRQRDNPKGPRTIDIDIVLYDSVVLDSPELVLPHPRMAQRRFVLEPLTELAPELVHPILRKTMRDLLTDTLDQELALVRPIAPA